MFLLEVTLKLETKWNQQGRTFYLILLGIPSSLIFSVKNREWGREIYLMGTKSVKREESYLSTIPKMIEKNANILTEETFLYSAFSNLI